MAAFGVVGKKPMAKQDLTLLDPSREVWEQLPEETDTPFQYFLRYRDMGVGRQRNVQNLALSLGLSPQTLHIYSSQFNWIERVKAWDTYQLERRNAELEERRSVVRKLTWDDTLHLRAEMINRILSTIPDIEKMVTPIAMETVREQGSDVVEVRVKVEVDANYWRQVQEAIALSNRELRIAAEMPTNYTSSKMAVDHQSSTFETFLQDRMKELLGNG